MPPRWLGVVLSVLVLIVAVVAENDTGLDTDPYLPFKPPFARSLPVQILVTGVVFTLVAVLFVHLLFTGQYHWPLAPVNYTLQLAGVTTLLISLIATLNVVLARTISESNNWPYMVSYLAVPVPPSDEDLDDHAEWSLAERATWTIMMATTSVLVQITHIQFLGLLYPSTLEKRLIFSLLGPLALLSATMQLVPISASAGIEIVSAVRNVCNATLSLLFTAALFIWGLLVNRLQAWRTDGGTAVFGVGALALAIASTALNILYVPREEEYVWLPGLMWAVTLWQSFLGWWWWVGAGSGATTDEVVEEVLRRGQKISGRRKQRRGNRRADGDGAKSETSSRRWRVFRNERRGTGTDVTDREESQPRRRREGGTDGENESRSVQGPDSSDNRPQRSGTSSATSEATSSSGTLPGFLPRIVHQWYANLQHAHVAAARVQAEERRERIMELERAERERARAERERALERLGKSDENKGKAPKGTGGGWFRVGVPGTGWGLGHFGWRHANNRQAAETAYEMEAYDSSRRRGRERRNRESGTDEYTDEDEEAEQPEGEQTDPPRGPFIHYPTTENQTPIPPAAPAPERKRSLWWWGPLGRWRLQDSTTY